MMTVKQLRDLLEDFDDDANVFIMSQPHWPFEYSVAGAVERREFIDGDDDDYEDTSDDRGELKLNDVFLLEGTQLRYGSKDAWNAI